MLFDDDDDDNGDDVFLAGRRVVDVVEAEEAAGRSTDRDTTGCGVVLKDETDVANDANRIRRNIGVVVGVQLRLCNLKRCVLHLAETKNSSWTDRRRKSGRFEHTDKH